MNRREKWHYVEEIRLRYHTSKKQEKKVILDEFCKTSHYHRKHAIYLLHKGSVEIPKKRRGPKQRYAPEQILLPLERIWLATDMMCGKRLKKAMPLWLPHYEKVYEPLSEELRQQLSSVSAATLDRLLQGHRHHKKLRGISGTRPGYLLKNQIEIKTEHGDVQEPGFLEADTVAHCGSSMSGEFVWSVTFVDIWSGWTEIRATWNKEAQGLVEQVEEVERVLPFNLRGFDCDNGSEFLNYQLLRYLQNREEPVHFTRSRPYKKNDNAHVEQKNWTGVRHIFSYYRLDQKRFVDLMNDIYKNEWSLLLNFFYPSMQLKEKIKVNSKYRRIYNPAQTAYQRLLNSSLISKEKKRELTEVYKKLNPFQLKKNLEKKLKHLFSYVEDFKTNRRRRI